MNHCHETREASLVPNFRDIGETVNVLGGAPVMKEGVLLRGGRIDFVDQPGAILSPHTIVAEEYELSSGPLRPELLAGALAHFSSDRYFRKTDVAALRKRFLEE